MTLTQQIREGLGHLNLSPGTLRAVLQMPDVARARRALRQHQEQARKTFRRQCHVWRPDRIDTPHRRTFEDAKAALDWVLALDVTRRPAPAPGRVPHVVTAAEFARRMAAPTSAMGPLGSALREAAKGLDLFADTFASRTVQTASGLRVTLRRREGTPS